jgi:hypothetical protein
MIKLKHGSDPDSRFDRKQLAKGTRVEKEHTNDPKIARQIAKAHLSENKNYYKYLTKMEHCMKLKKLERGLL